MINECLLKMNANKRVFSIALGIRKKKRNKRKLKKCR